MLHNKQYDLQVQAIVLAVNFATAAMFRTKIAFSIVIFWLN